MEVVFLNNITVCLAFVSGINNEDDSNTYFCVLYERAGTGNTIENQIDWCRCKIFG